jgi:polysaccharide deacetylase family protein (PEP-CTERM system associated)
MTASNTASTRHPGTADHITRPAGITHVISVDVEDYFQVEAFTGVVDTDSWNSWPSRVVENTRRVLDLFGRHNAKGTFFFLGWVAERFPSLVREVESQGHEIACHSYWHRPIYRLTRDEFREDTRMACDAIQQACGKKVLGYRAPTWSITKNSLWALDILAEEGMVYDSSVFPIRHDLYGIPDAPHFSYTHTSASALQLVEFPPATVRVAGRNIPVAGGGYLRLFPLSYTLWALRRYEKKYLQPAVVYFHPWELDRQQPSIRAGAKSQIRHYTNIDLMEERLAAMLRTHRFQPFRELLAAGNSGATTQKLASVSG